MSWRAIERRGILIGEVPLETARPRLGRRRFLQAVAGISVLGAGDAFGLEPRWLDVTVHGLPIAGLPQALEGLTIAHVTDAHLKRLGSVENAIVEAVRKHGVRLVALTGDIVDDDKSLPLLGELVAALRAAGAECVASFGNWEHWAGFEPRALADQYARFGARLLVNDAIEVGGLAIAATDDGYVGAPRWDRTLAALSRVLRHGQPKFCFRTARRCSTSRRPSRSASTLLFPATRTAARSASGPSRRWFRPALGASSPARIERHSGART